MLHDLTIAFAMEVDRQGLTYEAGIRAADDLASELMEAAEQRESFAPKEND